MRKNRPVSFNDDDADIVDWIDSEKLRFSVYVKRLIREDMKKQNPVSDKHIEDIVVGVLNKLKYAPPKQEETVIKEQAVIKEHIVVKEDPPQIDVDDALRKAKRKAMGSILDIEE